MAETTKVDVRVRTDKGKAHSRRMRRAGDVPAIVYGHDTENIMIAIPLSQVHTVSTARGLVELIIDEKPTPVLVRDIQRDYLKDAVLHVDFQVVRMDEKIGTTVPLIALGEAAGIANGGVLDQIMHEIEIECLPGNMPEQLEYDVSHLTIDDVVTISELPVPEGVEIQFTDPDQPVFSCTVPRMEVEEEEEEEEGLGEDLLEPELIGGKDEDEDEAEEEDA